MLVSLDCEYRVHSETGMRRFTGKVSIDRTRPRISVAIGANSGDAGAMGRGSQPAPQATRTLRDIRTGNWIIDLRRTKHK